MKIQWNHITPFAEAILWKMGIARRDDFEELERRHGQLRRTFLRACEEITRLHKERNAALKDTFGSIIKGAHIDVRNTAWMEPESSVLVLGVSLRAHRAYRKDELLRFGPHLERQMMRELSDILAEEIIKRIRETAVSK